MERKTVLILCGSVIGFLLVLILGLWIFTLFNQKTSNFEEVEKLIINATEKYYRDNPSYLPVDNGKYNLSYSTLVEGEYIKPLSELIEDGELCSSEIIVVKKDETYSYIPKLNCGDLYVTKTLAEQILETNQVVTEDSGLYQDNDNSYYYRGKVENNYVAFGSHTEGKEKLSNLWRIISIEDGKVKLLSLNPFEKRTLWDNRYNTTISKQYGYNDFDLSVFSDYLIAQEKDNEYLNESELAKIEPTNLCIGKRTFDDDISMGNIECDKLSKETYLFGTLTPYEYLRASLDEDCKTMNTYACRNFNYLSYQHSDVWLTTSSFDNDYEVHIFSGRNFNNTAAKNQKYVIPTIVLSEFAFFKSGSGTLEDPYTIK